MNQKILIIILCTGFLIQVYAGSGTWTTTAAEDKEYMMKSFKLLLTLGSVAAVPLLITGAIVGIVKIIKHGGSLIFDIFKEES